MNLRLQKINLMLCCTKPDFYFTMKEYSTIQRGRVLSSLYKHMNISLIFYSYFLMNFGGFVIEWVLWCNYYFQFPGAELQHLSQQCPAQTGACSEEDWAPPSIIDIQLNPAGFSDKVKFQQCRISHSGRLRLLRTSASCGPVTEYE